MKCTDVRPCRPAVFLSGALLLLLLLPGCNLPTGDPTVDYGASVKISATEGGFTGTLHAGDEFGFSAASIGDLDGNGIVDVAVGAPGDDDGGADRGAVWILFLSASGTVQKQQKISATAGGFGGALDDKDNFGQSVAGLGSLGAGGPTVLAVGAPGDDDGGADRGAVWILFLSASGTVQKQQKISATAGGFGGALDNYDKFGRSIALIGLLDADGVPYIAVGADQDGDGGAQCGAVWVLYLRDDGTVKDCRKISNSPEGGFDGEIQPGDWFGNGAAGIGDLDHDGVNDLAVGAMKCSDGGFQRGAVWIVRLNADGTVKAKQKISATAGGFTGTLDDDDRFGRSPAGLGDLDGDGVIDIVVGAIQDDDGQQTDSGAVWVLFLKEDGTVKGHQKISNSSGGFKGRLDRYDLFGKSVTRLGDLDQDGIDEVLVGAYGDGDGGQNCGAVWILFFNSDGTVR